MRTLVIRMTMPVAHPAPEGYAESLFRDLIEPSLRPFGDARLVIVEAPTAEEEAELSRLGRRAGTPPASSDEVENGHRRRAGIEATRRELEALVLTATATAFELLAQRTISGGGPTRGEVEEAMRRAFMGTAPVSPLERIDRAYVGGELSESQQPPMRVEISLDPIRRPGEGEPRAIVSVRDGYGQIVPDAVLYLGPNEMVAVTVEKEGPPQIGERQRLGPKEVDMGGQS